MARGCIIKRGNKWSIVYRDPTTKRQKWQAIGPKKKDAERALAEVSHSINQGTYRELKTATFPDFARKWLKIYAEANLKLSTLRSYRQIVEKELIPFFGERMMTQISPDLIQSYIPKKLFKSPKPLKASSVIRHLAPLKEMLKHAVKWGYLNRNPAQDLEMPRVEKQEMDFLTPGETRLLLENTNKDYYCLFLTAALTGLRQGELLALTWDDIDWHNETISVRRSLYRGKLQTPKSKNSFRKVIMPRVLADALFAHQVDCSGSSLNLVFPAKNGQPLDPCNVVKREFLPALRRAGLRRVRFHDLRHSYAAMLIHQGENLKFVQSQLGHASITTTIDRYGHLLPGTQKKAANRLQETLFGKNSVSNLLAKMEKSGKNGKNYSDKTPSEVGFQWSRRPDLNG